MSSPSIPVANPDGAALDRFVNDSLTEKGAFESTMVDTAARLLMQLNRDLSPKVQAKLVDYYNQFAQELAASYSPGDTATQVQAAMESVSNYPGLGPATKIAEAVLYHATSVNGIYEYNISSAYKKVKAIAMGQTNPDRNPSFWEKAGSPVYWAWLDEVMACGGEVPVGMVNKKSLVVNAESFSWWTPSELMDLPRANDFQEAAEMFFKACQIVSLAPDWFVWGGAGVSLKTAGLNPIRPTPLDGLNPLWVQHPAGEKARTGGGAEEVLIEGPIGVGEVLPIRIFPLDPSTHEALKAAPSVETYANNLCLAMPPGQQPDADRVAFWQVTIVKQCRESRANADEQFTTATFDATCGCQGTEDDAGGQL